MSEINNNIFFSKYYYIRDFPNNYHLKNTDLQLRQTMLITKFRGYIPSFIYTLMYNPTGST